jgi:hypothetical protein
VGPADPRWLDLFPPQCGVNATATGSANSSCFIEQRCYAGASSSGRRYGDALVTLTNQAGTRLACPSCATL